jgi:hypothetical protein
MRITPLEMKMNDGMSDGQLARERAMDKRKTTTMNTLKMGKVTSGQMAVLKRAEHSFPSDNPSRHASA